MMTASRARSLVTAYVALGANLGDARASVLQAQQDLSCLPGAVVTASSRLYRSAPVDAVGPEFINAVVELQTELTAPALLRALQDLEQAGGRQRTHRNAPRTLDLDLLLYGDGRIDSPQLTLPHPRMDGRAFVLLPLADVAPRLVSAHALACVAEQACEAQDTLSGHAATV